MSHRRKSTQPLSKQKRIGFVVDRVLAAKCKQQQEQEKLSQELKESNGISATEDSANQSTDALPQNSQSSLIEEMCNQSQCNSSSNSVTTNQDVRDSQSSFIDTSNQNLEIPDDLFNDFEALKSATHLDTADLMRKLIKDYARLTGKSSEGQDITKLSEYYNTEESKEESNAPLDLSLIKTEPQDGSPLVTVPPYQLLQYVPGLFQTSATATATTSASTNVRQGSHLFPANIECSKSQQFTAPPAGMYFYSIGGQTFPLSIPDAQIKSPTIVHDPSLLQGNSNMEAYLAAQERHMGPATVDMGNVAENIKSMEAMRDKSKSPCTKRKQDGSSPQSDSESCREVQFQNGCVKIKGTKLQPEIQVGDLTPNVNSMANASGNEFSDNMNHHEMTNDGAMPQLTTNTMLVNSLATPLLPIHELIPEAGQIISRDSVQQLMEVSMATAVTNQDLIASLSPGQMPMQGFQLGIDPKTLMSNDDVQNASLRAVQDLQKIAAKPPHSGKGEKASKNSKKNSGRMKLLAENMSNRGVYTSVLKLPWSRRTRTPKNDPQSPAPVQETQETTQPMVLVPVGTTENSPQGQVFIPNSNMSATSAADMLSQSCTPATTTQPMMMVYPNSTFSNANKPVRKRGRPPKVPVLARMLAEANKMAAQGAQLQNFFPTMQQPAAIVLNVNNMVSPTGTNVSTTAAPSNNTVVLTSAGENHVIETVPIQPTLEVQQQVSVSPQSVHPQQLPQQEIKNPATVAMEAAQSPPIKCSSKQPTDFVPIMPQPQSTMNNMTTTSVSGTGSGALYQEMILSSKSLVTVQPRRRQTTTELLRAKSGHDNFICTSFRLGSLNGKQKKEKKNPIIPGMKRRGRPPKRKMGEMFDVQSVLPQQGNVQDQMLSMVQQIPQLYSQVPVMLNPSSIQGDNPNTSVMQDFSVHSDVGTNSSALEPKLFDGVIDGNYENPLLANQFRVENSSSEKSLSQGSGHQERFVFSSDEDVMQEEDKMACLHESSSSSDDEGSKDTNDIFQKLFHCKVCNEIIPVDKKNEHWEKHVRVKIKCTICGIFCHKFLLKDQSSTNAESICENCEKGVVGNAMAANIHLPVAMGDQNTQTRIICEFCSNNFVDLKALRSHVKVDHPESYPIFKAKLLGLKLQRDKLLIVKRQKQQQQQQQQSHMKSNELKVYECPVEDCNKKVYSKFRIKNHIRKRHESKQFATCLVEGCKKRFHSSTQLQEHVRFKHYSVKGYTCSWPGCDEQFQNERNLKVHLLIHKDEKPLKCDFCDYRCRQHNALQWHTRKHHPEASNSTTSFPSGSSGSSAQGDEIDE